MTLGYSAGGGGGGYDYIQSTEPSNPETGEEWLDTSEGESYVFDGSTWQSTTVTDHGELANVSAGDHFDAGSALAFNGGLLDLVYADPFAVSGDTLGLDTLAPFTLSNGSLALSLGNALTVDGSDALGVVESDISHDNLAGVGSSDHHSRYSDSEARSAVDGSTVSLDHDNLTGVSVGDHHSRYSDSEARSAVDGSTVSLDHDNLTGVSPSDHFDAGSALAFNGDLLDLVYGDPFAVSGDTLGLDSAAPFTLSNGALALSLGNALTVDGSDALGVVESDISHDNLAGVSPSDHHSRYSDSEARSAVDGSSVSVDHDNLTGVSPSDHFDAGSALAFNGGLLDLVYADPFAVSGDTLGLDTVAPFTLSSGALALNLGTGLGLNTSRLAVQPGDISHNDLAGISPGDHFSAGSALAFNGSMLDLVYADPFAVSGDTLGLDTLAPFTLSNGSLALSLGNALTVDGSNDLAVSEGDISHDNLAGVSSSDHHSRYSDSEARSAVDGSSVSVDHDNLTGVGSSDHHSKTTSASELSDVSPDSDSDAHHSRYSDSEARSAVDGANVDIAGDADTVDGQDASDLGGGVFGWTETSDSGASLQAGSGGSGGTATLNISTSYDLYKFHLKIVDDGDGAPSQEISQLNGNSVNTINADGTTDGTIGATISEGQGYNWTASVTFRVQAGEPVTVSDISGQNKGGIADGCYVFSAGLSSITFKSVDESASYTVAVYGKNI